MTKFTTLEEMITARAEQRNESNLRDGGVVNKDLEKVSDLSVELELAKKRS